MDFRTYVILAIMSGACASCSPTGSKTATANTAEHIPPAHRPSAASDTVAATDTVTIALTGDIMMGTTYPDSVLPPDCGRALFSDAEAILRRADVTVGNLEGTICDTTYSTNKKASEHSYAFRTPPELAPRLKEAGFDFLSMANNHTYDFGSAGIRSTETELSSLGIRFAGIQGHDELAVIERRGIKFGLCAFGHNAHTLRMDNPSKVRSILDSLRIVADIIIVSFHGGAEGSAYSHLPYGKEEFLNENRGSLREFARFCIDHGADIVYGHGPHVVRCIETYRNRFIAYSLGNFCTPYGISILGISGYAPVIEVKTDRHGRFLNGTIHPFIQRKGLGPRRDTTGIVIQRIKELTAEDIPQGNLRISNNGKIVLSE